MDEDFQFLFKIILIGDSSVGKTNLLTRFVRNEFNLQSKPTIGVDFYSKTVEIDENWIKAQIWDTAGQERFKAFSSAYYNGAHGAIIVYDISKRETYDNVENWLKEIKTHLNPEDTVQMLIGNKSDLSDKRQVQLDEGQELAEKHDLFFMETSALKNEGGEVSNAFMCVIEEIYKRSPERDGLDGIEGGEGNQQLNIGDSDNSGKKKSKKCC